MASQHDIDNLSNQKGSSESSTAPKSVVLGKLGKTHGIKGWLRIISFTSPAENLLDYRFFRAQRATRAFELEIDQYKQQASGFIAHVKGYDTPEAARELTGLTLSVAVTELPELDQDDVYWYQLEGLEVSNQHQQVLGTVTKLLETGANDVLVVTPNESSIDERERLIPFIRDTFINEIDLTEGSLKVIWEADYLE